LILLSSKIQVLNIIVDRHNLRIKGVSLMGGRTRAVAVKVAGVAAPVVGDNGRACAGSRVIPPGERAVVGPGRAAGCWERVESVGDCGA